jgi:hypothetical protein
VSCQLLQQQKGQMVQMQRTLMLRWARLPWPWQILPLLQLLQMLLLLLLLLK